jgi:putative ABC transport system ATP-binding protein
VHRPEIVLADEPSGNLDTATSQSIFGLLHDLNEDGSTIVVITHDHEVADSLPRQVGIRDGVIEYDSAPGIRDLA